MDLGAIVSRAKKAAADNSPTILTAIGVTGTITTVILASKASFKAQRVLDEHHHEFLDPDLERSEMTKNIVRLTWRLYVPAAATGVITVASIVTANHVSTRRAAALASAYSISQEAFKEYKDRVQEKLGEKKEQALRDEIAQERVILNPPSSLIIASDNNVLCFDMHSGRYFTGNMESIRKAMNDINFQIIHEDNASLSDFWELVGLPKTTESDEIGWNTDKGFNVEFSSLLTEDGRPCLAISFHTIPLRGYYKNSY